MPQFYVEQFLTNLCNWIMTFKHYFIFTLVLSLLTSCTTVPLVNGAQNVVASDLKPPADCVQVSTKEYVFGLPDILDEKKAMGDYVIRARNEAVNIGANYVY